MQMIFSVILWHSPTPQSGRQPEISPILRRHMDSITWAEAFEKLLESRGVKREERAWNDLTGATVAAVAKEIGVPERTAFRRLQTVEELKPHPEMRERGFSWIYDEWEVRWDALGGLAFGRAKRVGSSLTPTLIPPFKK